MTKLKIWTEVQRFEASDGLALQTQVAAAVIRMLSGAMSKFKEFPSFFFFFFSFFEYQVTNYDLLTEHSPLFPE